MGVAFGFDLMSMNRTYEFKLVHVNVVICGINHASMKLYEHSKLIEGDLDVYLKVHNYGWN